MDASLLLYLVIVILLEYGLKALFEGTAWRSLAATSPGPTTVRRAASAAAPSSGPRADGLYAAYRLTTLVAHAAVLWGLSPLDPGRALLIAAILTALASTEIVASLLSGWIYLRRQHLCRSLHLVPHALFLLALLYVGLSIPWSRSLPYILNRLHAEVLPFYALDHLLRIALPFLLAATPSNYAIRWLMNKEEDSSLPELAVGDLLLRLPLTTPRTATSWPVPAAAAEGTQVQTMRAGRTIGTLERWMLLALMAGGKWPPSVWSSPPNRLSVTRNSIGKNSPSTTWWARSTAY